METELGGIDEQLVKLEADAAQASGDAKRILEQQIEKLREARHAITAQGDIVLAAGQDNELVDETEEARHEIEEDIP